MRSLFIVLFLPAVLLTYGYAQEPEKPSQEESPSGETSEEEVRAQINELLKQLASRHQEERESAQSELKKLFNAKRGLVLEYLQKVYENTKDVELKSRVKQVLAPYERWGVTPAVLDEIPNILELLDKNTFQSIRTALSALHNLDSDVVRGVFLSVTATLSKGLEDEDARAREQTTVLLGDIGKLAVEPLIRSLRDKDWRVREVAAVMLGRTRSKRAVAPLIEAVRDKSEDVRGMAIYALGTIGDKKAVGAVIGALKDKNYYVRMRAATTLAKIKDSKSVEPLIEALKDRHKNIRHFAAGALRELADNRAVEPLIEALKDNDTEVRRSAAAALGAIGDEKAVEPLLRGLKHEDPRMRASCAGVLEDIGGKKVVGSLRKLWKGDKDKWVKIVAAGGVAGIAGDDEAFRYLHKFLKDKEENTRISITFTLGGLGDARSLEPLFRAFAEDNDDVRCYIVRALGRIKGEKASAFLIKALQDKDQKLYVHSYIATALGETGDRRAVSVLIGKLKSGHWPLRRNAADALGKIGDKDAVDALVNALRDKDRRVRCHVVQALGKMGGEKALVSLVGGLKDKDWRVRCDTVKALAHMGLKQAVSPLIRCVKDIDEDVRDAACGALKAITKQDFGSDYDKWKQWYEDNREK